MDKRRPTTERRETRREEEVPKDHRPEVEPKLAKLRFKLGQKAKQEPGFRFYSLFGLLLREDVLRTAWKIVSRRKSANTSGVDGVVVAHIMDAEGGPEAFVAGIREELRRKTYRPDPVKRIEIPKKNGKMRPIGIPTIRDRVVQTGLLLLLEPIFEADFLDCSHGFRPGRSAHKVVEEITSNIKKKYRAVYDADLKGYFDSIPHDKLMLGMETRIADHSILKLLRMFLRAPVQTDNEPPVRPTMGTPQGGVISPLLANCYLHWFDRAFYSKSGPGTWAKARLIRYADDFVIMARFIDKRMTDWIEHTIEGRLGLVINREKTTQLNIEDEGAVLEFLGYSFRWSRSHLPGGGRPYVRVEASKGSQLRARDKVRVFTGAHLCFYPVEQVIGELNLFLKGWLNYFRSGHPVQARWALIRFTENRVVRHLRRRSQRPYRPPKGVQFHQHVRDLGLIGVSVKPSG